MEELEKKLTYWFNNENSLNFTEINIQPQKDENKNIYIEINLESKCCLGMLLIYPNGFANIDIHDKIKTIPILVKSIEYNSLETLINKLSKVIYENWK
jgi:hypothetical protein